MEGQKQGRHDMKSYSCGAELLCHNVASPSSEILCKICALKKHPVDT
jgi:hypothetical protein